MGWQQRAASLHRRLLSLPRRRRLYFSFRQHPFISRPVSAQCACVTTQQRSPVHSIRPSIMALPYKAVPLVAPGHTRPVTHLSFSSLQDDGTYVLISSCKDGNPMLREWTGDWIGTFIGHKGAVWSSKLSPDTSRAASGSADFTACVSPPFLLPRARAPCEPRS